MKLNWLWFRRAFHLFPALVVPSPPGRKQRDPVLAAPLMAMTLGCCQWLPCTEKPWTQALLLRNLLSESLAGKRRPVFHIFPVSRAIISKWFHPSNFQPTLEHAVTCSSSGLKLQSSCHPNPEPWWSLVANGTDLAKYVLHCPTTSFEDPCRHQPTAFLKCHRGTQHAAF